MPIAKARGATSAATAQAAVWRKCRLVIMVVSSSPVPAAEARTRAARPNDSFCYRKNCAAAHADPIGLVKDD
ncbi:hypothetical protein BDS110ZK25_43900 [Bradyrhizobium diazoefficiens]|uniref:Uncharacterized protein n=1 Tax=Bradyrhizobium diazoefficiens TaxID=1355477 RepID=A0A810CF88_9BRAD|nr:hypothetical protein F07S3_84740 [Bradyrhizobium diazoefficiens]BCA16330.1 hypothetical protein BDHF08_81770 [Bradyrhizobium diazoefficiens]BCA25017.1 hypothetical protein BDHH15_82320 [Bradyrhizobium diazoefficiens]BCE25752.1 hypothetical protein XF1B_84330 [Bradyrhizobium diazoefficiens]BCE34502.1 hypothetical protein XF2B_82710 [Bradyrhizobium diazoefficiens]